MPAAVALAMIGAAALRAQDQFPFENELLARKRVFSVIGPGFRAIHPGPNGRYYILTAPAPAVQIFDGTGARLGQAPNTATAAAKSSALVYGESFDVDAAGNVVVADRGADAVKLYTPDGALALNVPVNAPSSVVLLSGGEIAVVNSTSSHLITVFDMTGKSGREFGNLEDVTPNDAVNRLANLGDLARDAANNIYFAFDFVPEPTVRKYDRGGYVDFEISLNTLEFEASAESARKSMARTDTKTPVLHRIITALGVDPANQDVWFAMGTLLIHFDKDGKRLANYRIYTASGARLEASAIMVEPDRLLIGNDPLGIYEFARPDKIQPGVAQ